MANSTELLTAISSRDLELVRSICSDNSNRHLILKYRDRYHGNILHRAVASSSPDIVEILIKAGADPTETNYYGWSALSYAVYHNQLPMLRFMLPNASALSAPNLFGFTPLMIAIYQGNLELVKFILNATVGFDINTPLDESFSGSSVRHGNEQSGNHRNSPNNMVLGGIVGLTPLMLASHRGSVECVQLLLQRGAECNAQCKLNGWTAIMYATERSELRVIQILLDNGADIQMRNWMGKTAADVGLEIGDERVLESLVERSIDRYLPEPDFRDGSVNLTKNSREGTAEGNEVENVFIPSGCCLNFRQLILCLDLERSHNVTYATSHPRWISRLENWANSIRAKSSESVSHSPEIPSSPTTPKESKVFPLLKQSSVHHIPSVGFAQSSSDNPKASKLSKHDFSTASLGNLRNTKAVPHFGDEAARSRRHSGNSMNLKTGTNTPFSQSFLIPPKLDMANIHVANRHSLPPSPVTPSSPNSVSFPPGTLNSSQQLKSKRDFRKAASSAALLQTSELSNSSSSSSGVTNRREGAGKKAISSPLIGPIPNISPQGSDLQSLDPQIRAFITSNNLEHFSAVLSPNVSTLDDILNITDQDLVRWGITSQANRRMIQVAIAAHKAKLLQTETIKASTKGPDAYVLQTNGPQTPIPRTPVGGRRVVSSTLIEPPKSQHNELDDWKWIRSDRAKAT